MSDTQVTTDAYPPPAAANYALGVLTVAYVFSFVDRQILSLMVEPIKRDLQVSDFQMGLLQGMAFALFYAILGLPLGRLADRFNRRVIIGVGIFCWSIMTAASGLSRNFTLLFITRMGVGVGEAGLSPSAYSLLSDFYPPHRLARALAIYTMGITVGGGLAYLVGGSVIELVSSAESINLPIVGAVQPWQATFFIVGLPGLLLVPMVYFMREPGRRGRMTTADGKREIEAVPFGQVVRFILDNRAIFFPLFVGASMLAVIGYGTLNWYPTFLIRTYGMNVGDIGLQFGLIYMVFGTLGAFGSALVSERLASRGRTDANLRVVMLVAIALVVPAAIGPLMPEKWMALCFAAPMIMLLNAHLGVTVAAIAQVTPNQMRATVSAMMLFMTNIFGLGLGAVLIASLTDFVFGDEAALRYSLATVAIVVGPLAGALLWKSLAPFRERLARMDDLLVVASSP